MIQVLFNNETLIVTGHSKNEPCTRVSTAFDIFCMCMGKSITKLDRSYGRSYCEFNVTKKNKETFEVFYNVFLSIAEMYPNMVSTNLKRNGDHKDGEEL